MLKQIVLILTLTIFNSINAFSQSDDIIIKSDAIVDAKGQVVEALPEYPGGTEALMQKIQGATKYPKSARKEGIEGQVVISFLIDTLGMVSDVEVLRSVREDLDKEAVRVVKLLNGWKPGVQDGKKVSVYFNVPFNFRLGKKEKQK